MGIKGVPLCSGVWREDLNCLKFFVNFHSSSRPFYNFAPLKEKSIFGHMLFVETGHVDKLWYFQVPGHWFLITCPTGMLDTRKPHNLSTCMPFSIFLLQSSHLRCL